MPSLQLAPEPPAVLGAKRPNQRRGSLRLLSATRVAPPRRRARRRRDRRTQSPGRARAQPPRAARSAAGVGRLPQIDPKSPIVAHRLRGSACRSAC
jgi:hypothetical protein